MNKILNTITAARAAVAQAQEKVSNPGSVVFSSEMQAALDSLKSLMVPTRKAPRRTGKSFRDRYQGGESVAGDQHLPIQIYELDEDNLTNGEYLQAVRKAFDNAQNVLKGLLASESGLQNWQSYYADMESKSPSTWLFNVESFGQTAKEGTEEYNESVKAHNSRTKVEMAQARYPDVKDIVEVYDRLADEKSRQAFSQRIDRAVKKKVPSNEIVAIVGATKSYIKQLESKTKVQ